MRTHIAAVNQSDWLAGILAGQPGRVAGALAARHAEEEERDGQRAANVSLLDHIERYRGRIRNDADDDELKAWADQYARAVCEGIANAQGDDYMLDYAIGHQVCTGASIEPPRPVNVDDADEMIGCIARMRCKYWWRRKIRVAFGRRVEQSARALGFVHKRRDLYISADGWKRWTDRQNANAATLADSVAVCDNGVEMTLAEVAAVGVSNPAIRRAELMTRIRGLEESANRLGDRALFVTWTVPPELHAAHASGEAGDGKHITPREGQAWLRKQWAKARAKFARAGVEVYGLRVAEPHHDGTPHWHLLLFVNGQSLPMLEQTLIHYVLDGDTRPKRIRHGYDHTRIDPAKGSATGYVAKYVAKSIDSFAVDVASSREADGGRVALDIDPQEAANRVRAWASTWGIRQFQFIGAPPVGPWRELRRLEPITAYAMERAPALRQVERLRLAADSGDWCGYVEQMGGPCTPRDEQPAKLAYLADAGTGRYGDPVKRVYVEAYGRVIWTRSHTWEIEYKPKGDNHADVDGCCGGVGNAGVRAGGAYRPISLEPKARAQPVKRAPLGPAIGLDRIAAPLVGNAALVNAGAKRPPWTRENNCTPGSGNGHETRDRIVTGSRRARLDQPDYERQGHRPSDRRHIRGAGGYQRPPITH
ncbi:MAG: replication endonuclease [Salinisphaera sp.]|nr:replication endonuclease [Salinisphaera sp.]